MPWRTQAAKQQAGRRETGNGKRWHPPWQKSNLFDPALARALPGTVFPDSTTVVISNRRITYVGALHDAKTAKLEDIKDPDMSPYFSCCPGLNTPEGVAAACLFLETAKNANGVELPFDKGWLLA